MPLNAVLGLKLTRTTDQGLSLSKSLPNQTDFSSLQLGNNNQPQNNFRNMEPPPRNMPNLTSQNTMSLQQQNMQMDIANLPAPLTNNNTFDNVPTINTRENQNFVNNLSGIVVKFTKILIFQNVL